MAPRVPEAGSETLGNGVLNKQENPSWSEGQQFTLGRADQRVSEGASHIGVLVKRSQASNGFTLGTVASIVGKETPYVSKCLDIEDPHAVLKMVAAVLLLDKDRTFLRGFVAMTGCRVVEEPELSDAEFRRRVEAKARQRKSDSAWLEEALGETVP